MSEKIGTIIACICFIFFLAIGALLFFLNTVGHGFITKISTSAEIFLLIISGIIFVLIFVPLIIKMKEEQGKERKKWDILFGIFVYFLISLFITFLAWGFMRQFFYP